MKDEILKTSFLDGQIEVNKDNILICNKCGEQMKDLRKSYPLKSHISLIYGFVELHKNCSK